MKHWYAVDILERPTGPDKTRWKTPGVEATILYDYPSWERFWSSVPSKG